jgi:hypothetical protein
MTTVRFTHVRGLTPDVSATDMPLRSLRRGSAGMQRAPVRNGRVPGLTPDMARRDT